MSLKIVSTPYSSLCQGDLPTGCEGCVRGEKLVLFITGICPASCFFCPLSETRKGVDVVYANELLLAGTEEEQITQMIDEAKSHGATGAGITGGDPLARLDRTCRFIIALKKAFGKGFHIHLYTPLILVNEITMRKLYEAGLDEIRFHPSLSNERFWPRMKIARKYPWQAGLEIPIFPDRMFETKLLIDYSMSEKLIDFLNLNELEISERSLEEFERRRYHIASKSSYAIKGSRKAAMEIMTYAQRYDLPVHFCTSKLKDRVQMGNRIIKRAENTAYAFDDVDEEGLLTRGAIYHGYSPGFGYERMLKSLSAEDRETELQYLMTVFHTLIGLEMPADAGVIDAERLRILLNADALRALAGDLHKRFPDAKLAVIKEYPTSDTFIVELEQI